MKISYLTFLSSSFSSRVLSLHMLSMVCYVKNSVYNVVSVYFIVLSVGYFLRWCWLLGVPCCYFNFVALVLFYKLFYSPVCA